MLDSNSGSEEIAACCDRVVHLVQGGASDLDVMRIEGLTAKQLRMVKLLIVDLVLSKLMWRKA